jgi:hypothetical protein
MCDIEKYKEILKRLAETDSEEFVNNSSLEHAIAMIEAIFKYATSGKAYLLGDHLEATVYERPEIKDAVNAFLGKEGSRIDIIMQFNEKSEESALHKNAFIDLLKQHNEKSKKVRFFRAINELKTFNNHFLVLKTDQGRYSCRFETDINKRFATGSFNAKEYGEGLYDFFEKSIGKGSALQIGA